MLRKLNVNVYQLVTFLLLAVILLLNLTWNISDHDDGHTLAFHLMGRNPDLQRSYGYYDSMCDFLLGLLPPDYYLIFGAMVTATFISSVLILILLEKICQNYFKEKFPAGLITLLFLISMPEYLYMIFTFKSAIIGLVFILSAHYTLIKNTTTDKNSLWILLPASVLFGFGVSCRWNLLIYGLVIACDYFYLCYKREFTLVKSFRNVTVWGTSALCFAGLFIYLSGYGAEDFAEIVKWSKTQLGDDNRMVARIATGISFLTPLSISLLLIGLYSILSNAKNNIRMIVLTISSFLPFFIMGLSYSLKYYITLSPFIFIVFREAILFIQNKVKLKPAYKYAFFVIVGITPWLIGIQVSTPTSNWGPGFEIKMKPAGNKIDTTQKLDKRFKLKTVNAGFKSGSAIPTQEGVRPLFGHAYTLFGGDLKTLDAKLNREALDVVKLASEKKLTVFIDRINPYFLMALSKGNYLPDRNYLQLGPELVAFRYYIHKGDSIGELKFKHPSYLIKEDTLFNNLKGRKMIAYFSFSSGLNRLLDLVNKKEGAKTERIGPFTAYIDLSKVKL